jgi:hypothetical protein
MGIFTCIYPNVLYFFHLYDAWMSSIVQATTELCPPCVQARNQGYEPFQREMKSDLESYLTIGTLLLLLIVPVQSYVFISGLPSRLRQSFQRLLYLAVGFRRVLIRNYRVNAILSPFAAVRHRDQQPQRVLQHRRGRHVLPFGSRIVLARGRLFRLPVRRRGHLSSSRYLTLLRRHPVDETENLSRRPRKSSGEPFPRHGHPHLPSDRIERIATTTIGALLIALALAALATSATSLATHYHPPPPSTTGIMLVLYLSKRYLARALDSSALLHAALLVGLLVYRVWHGG